MTLVTFKKFVKKIDSLDKGLITFFVLGVVVSAISLFRGILLDRQVRVEYINGNEVNKLEIIVVDVEGAVMRPGVYELQGNARIKDALVSAGGMSVNADREYCEKNINLAEMVKDGEKVYIPFVGVTPSVDGYPKAVSEAKMVNVNTASEALLDTLWGVGESRIKSIVKNRPYKNIDELVKKGSMTKAIFEKNKDILTVY